MEHVPDIEELLLEFKRSLEREFGALRQEMRDGFVQLNNRFDTQA